MIRKSQDHRALANLLVIADPSQALLRKCVSI